MARKKFIILDVRLEIKSINLKKALDRIERILSSKKDIRYIKSSPIQITKK